MSIMGNKGSKQLPQFVLFGDSLTAWGFNEHTQGFGWFLERRYEGKAEVVNKGYAGYTTRSIAPEFDDLINTLSAASSPPTLLLTIFLGANDACLINASGDTYVPISQYVANLRSFVEEVLIADELADTNIVLITPPPINIPEPLENDRVGRASQERDPKKNRAYRTFVSKRTFAEAVMALEADYASTGRVVALDFWGALIDAGLQEQGREGDRSAEEKLPGCGLVGARAFGEGWFVDGLHLDHKAYNVLSRTLMSKILEAWPHLGPETIEA